jgi:farnesyl-diphosphate farnesyltransferase
VNLAVDRSTRPAEPDRDEAFCIRLLPDVSRTFALSIELLPDALREPVRVGYLLCRIVDTIEDDARLPLDAREALFEVFEAALTRGLATARALELLAEATDVGDVPAERELIRGASHVFARYAALRPAAREALHAPVLEMARGMRGYARRTHAAGRLRLTDVPDLERYCYFVAGTVGELLTALFAHVHGADAALLARVEADAVPFGLALQLVNIVKDCAEDQERGVCYLPESVAAAHGLTVEQLLDPAHRDAALAAVGEVCQVAGAYLRRAWRYTAAWPADGASGSDIRLFCLVPLVLALETLQVVVAGDDTLRPGRTPKVSREVVVEVLGLCRDAALDDAALAALGVRYGIGAEG